MYEPYSSSARPFAHVSICLRDRLDVADEAEHDLRFGERGNDVRLGAAVKRADVDRRVAEDVVGRQVECVERRQQLEHRLDRRLAEMRVRGVRGAAARADRDAQRSFRAARQLALGRLAVDEELARRREPIGRARAVGSLLFADDEQQVDALLAGRREVVGGDEHRRGDALGVARAATAQLVAVEPRRDVRRHGVEVRRQRDAAAGARRPDVGASAA